MKQIQITASLQNAGFNGGPATDMTQAQIDGLSFTVFIDTVDPPVKSYAVPASIKPVNKVVTVDLATLKTMGFVPVPGKRYFVDATESTGGLTSPPSAEIVYDEPMPQQPPLAPAVTVS